VDRERRDTVGGSRKVDTRWNIQPFRFIMLCYLSKIKTGQQSTEVLYPVVSWERLCSCAPSFWAPWPPRRPPAPRRRSACLAGAASDRPSILFSLFGRNDLRWDGAWETVRGSDALTPLRLFSRTFFEFASAGNRCSILESEAILKCLLKGSHLL